LAAHAVDDAMPWEQAVRAGMVAAASIDAGESPEAAMREGSLTARQLDSHQLVLIDEQGDTLRREF